MKTRILVALAVVALAAAAVWVYLWRGGSAAGPVILISIDTLRADRLPAYGYAKGHTPNLDAFAAESVLFERAYAHAPQTLPAHASMLTGLLPFEHGVRDNLGFTLDDGPRTLAEALSAAGYATAAFVSSYVLRAETGVGRGFGVYDDKLPPASPGASIAQVQRDGAATAKAALDWLQDRGSDRAFVFLHIYEPHTPYTPPARYAQYEPYDGDVAHADEIIGHFLAQLRERDLYENATVVVMSDHGEGLGDHGELEHGVFIYDESIRVPFMVKLPGARSAGRRVAALVQQIDLMPTLLDLAGVEPRPELKGRSLAPLLDGTDGRIREAGIYSESLYPRYHFGWSELLALTDGRYRYIKAPREELYDLESDPRELRNIAAERATTRAAMRAALDQLTAGAEVDRPAQVSDEARERLQALGYVGMQAEVTTGVAGESLPDPKDKVAVLETYRRAIDLANDRRFVDAIPLLESIVAENPTMADVWQQLGNLRMRVGRRQAAVDALKRFLELKPAEAAGAIAVAGALLRLERYEEAARHAELALKLAGDTDRRSRSSALEVLARIALARKDAEAARRYAALAEEVDPTLPMPLFVQARLLHDAGRFDEALPLLQKAIEQTRNRSIAISELHFYTGDTLARLDRYAEAEQELRREVRLFPNNSRAWASLAMLYRASGRHAAAAKAIDDMLAAVPTPDAHRLGARLWTMFGEPARARMVESEARRLGQTRASGEPR